MPELVQPSQLDPRLVDLQRPLHTGFTAGLCRALAQRWRVDPLIVRLVAVALTFAGGVGLALYAWGWLLTPRVGGQPPILRKLPAFGRWPRNTQSIVIAVSSLVLVLSLARQTGVAWGPVIVVGALAWAMTRRRSNGTHPNVTPPVGSTSPAAAATASPDAGETVEQWRSRLVPHTGSPLPTVDLYAPELSRSPAPVIDARPSHPTSWWAAAGVLVLSAVAAAVPFALGLSPALLWACVAAGGTAAISLLGWSLVARKRRMPIALLVLALVGAVGSGMLAVTHSQASTVPFDPADGGTASYSFVGEADAQLDLTDLPADTTATVTIDATASVVELRLSHLPGKLTLTSDTIYVDRPSYRDAPTASGLTLVIDGDFSVVELQVAP